MDKILNSPDISNINDIPKNTFPTLVYLFPFFLIGAPQYIQLSAFLLTFFPQSGHNIKLSLKILLLLFSSCSALAISFNTESTFNSVTEPHLGHLMLYH